MTQFDDDFRKLEREALEQASATADPKVREGLEQYAALWRQMAEEAEKGAKTA